MKPAFPLFLAAALGAALAATAPAGPDLDISSQVDRSEITIGDRIIYQIKVVYPAGGRVELPSVLGNLGTFEVKDYQAGEPEDAKGPAEPKGSGAAGKRLQQTWRFNLSTFTVGKYMIPPQQVILLRNAGDRPSQAGADSGASGRGVDSAVYFTQPIEINVVRTSPETVKDIADIAGTAELETGPPWLAIGLGLFLAAGIGAPAWRRTRRRGPREAGKPRLPPFEEALEMMKSLRPADAVRQNRAREYCFAVSEVLRRYVTRRFEIDALEATTTEFLQRAHPLPLTAAHKQWLGSFCEATDLIKFASGTLLETEAEQWHGQLLEFLRQTKPREEAPAPAAAAAGSAQGKAIAPKRGAVRPGTSSGLIQSDSSDPKSMGGGKEGPR